MLNLVAVVTSIAAWVTVRQEDGGWGVMMMLLLLAAAAAVNGYEI